MGLESCEFRRFMHKLSAINKLTVKVEQYQQAKPGIKRLQKTRNCALFFGKIAIQQQLPYHLGNFTKF